MLGTRFDIRQRTVASCPPLFDVDSPRNAECRGLNERIGQEIRERPPERVVMAANWSNADR
jgi:hypothetical protein